MGSGYSRSISSEPVQMNIDRAATLGRVGGHSRITATGRITTAAVGNDVWEGSQPYPFQFSASKLEALSASANDAAGGTGVQIININGLDGNWNQITEQVIMNGVTPVQTVQSFMRVNSCNIAAAGSGNVNAGAITVRLTGAGVTQAIMNAGYGWAKQTIYTVPAGYSLLVTDLLLQCTGVGNNTDVSFGFTRIGPTGIIQITNEYNATPASPLQRVVTIGVLIAEKTALSTRILAVTGTVGAYSSFEGILIDNTQLK